MLIAMGAQPGGGTGSGGSTLGMWLPIVMIFAIMYFLIFRPQAKKQKQQKMMIDSLKKGDKIVTIGGIFGQIVAIKEKEGTLLVKISDNTKVELARSSIAKVLGSE
ncbi:preprotein translocase subunit YajC [candidate division KSB1 bacterium 4572_119]|nr:MAG: preprotein translocase subunit YajC [candidate division KSB1 bacterium 4572_119]